MPKHLYLPLLVDANLAEPEQTAHWAAQEHKILLGIADGIVVDEGARIRGVSSVPDPWARALMFRAAIRPGSRHPLRKRLLQEWRGLLGVLALHRLHGYRLEIAPVPLERAGRFTDALRRLKPRPVELERGREYDWGDVLMVRIDGVPVGALSPATLVYTGADYATALRQRGFALTDEQGFLRPPDTPDDRRHLAVWLVELKGRLNAVLYRAEDNPHRGVIHDLNLLLSDWLGELNAGQDEPDAPEVKLAAEPVEPVRETRLLERYAVYRELLRPLDWAVERERHSELGLRMQRNRTGFREVVVITPHLLMSDARVWDNKRLTHLGADASAAVERHFAAASGTLIDREDISRHQSVWIRPDRYFLTDTLLAAPGGEPFLAEREGALNAGGRFAVPFRGAILDFFTPEFIQRELKPSFRETDTEVVFGFSLPVGPGAGAERVERAYRKKGAGAGQGMLRSAEPPVLDLFPDYLGPDWRRYYLFQASAGELHAVPVTGDPAYVAAERDHVDPATGARVRITELGGDLVFDGAGVQVKSPFPEGLELFLGSEAVGLVLTGTGGKRGDLSRTWRLGVDFGTSNTNVFRKDSEAENAERWQFDFPRHLRPLTRATEALRNPLLERFFVPNGRVDLPIPSLLRIHDNSRREHMFLDYAIPFGWEYRIAEGVHGNLKWDDEDRKTEYFLECLFFLLLIEVAERRIRTLDLACSYPKAFSMNASSIFRGDVERVRRKLVDDATRVLGTAGAGEGRRLQVLGPTFEVEGIAAGEFFASEHTGVPPTQIAMKQIAAVCLDVGGGTTDISIWSRNQITSDASVQLAGRQIARLLQRNLRLLEKLFPEPAAAALYERQNEPELFAARLNLVLRKEESHVRDMLLRHATHPEVLWLRRTLALEFCSIAFYAAALLGAASRTAGGAALAADLAESGVKLHWGGNAAKFITWIDLGRYDPDGIAAKLLNAMVLNGLRDAGITVRSAQLGQVQSPGHKSEAAGGLAVMILSRDQGPDDLVPADADDPLELPAIDDGDGAPAGASGAAAQRETVVCGENVTLAAGEVGYLDPLSRTMLFEGRQTTFRRTSLQRLERFLEIFNHFGVRLGLLTEESRVRLDGRAQFVRDRVLSQLVESARVPDGRRTLEPVFVTELKLLMDLLNADRR